MSSGHFDNHLFRSKNYLRQLLKNKLPSSVSGLIADRRKHGFETPKIKWLQSNLKGLYDNLFSKDNLDLNPYLNTEKVLKLLDNFKKQSSGVNNRLVWNLFCFLEWYRQHQMKFGL